MQTLRYHPLVPILLLFVAAVSLAIQPSVGAFVVFAVGVVWTVASVWRWYAWPRRLS